MTAAADAVDQGDVAGCRAALAELDGRIAAAGDGTHESRLARLFAVGLRARIEGDGAGGGNLYMAEMDDGVDMIGAFDTLVSSTPFIRFAYAAANHAIAAAAAHAHAPLHVVDIGIGEGTQWPSLFDMVGGRPIRLTGIDVPAPGADTRLAAVGARLADEAASRGVPFEFRGIAAGMEDVAADDLDLRPDAETVAVNLALALHHTSTDTPDPAAHSARDDVIARLHSLRPAVVALVEPDSEHDSLPFRPRVDEALRHYGAIFRALDALVAPDNPARSVLEEQFFGREIVNVVGFEGAERVERHHRHQAWGERFRRAGFAGVDLARWAADVGAAAGVAPPSSVTPDDGMLVLAWEGTPLLSASAWTPTRSPSPDPAPSPVS